jgi:ankyrin repeat protein
MFPPIEEADPNSKDQRGRTALILAAANGDEGNVRLFLATRGVVLNAKDDLGQSSLLWAAANGHEAVVQQLLSID